MDGSQFDSVSLAAQPVQSPALRDVRPTRAARRGIMSVSAESADQLELTMSIAGQKAMQRARRYLDANIHRKGVTVAEMVSAAGVSRSNLYRLFAPLGGLARFMWATRMDAARRAICDRDDRRSLKEIAEAFGFHDLSQFSRAFYNEFGLRPSVLRKMAR